LISIHSMTRISIPAIVLSAATAASLGAQTSTTAVPSYESRAHLEAEVREAESANRASEASLLRSRLKMGDFQEGDRIVVVLESNPTATDTMQVRAGKVLQFPRMSEVSLEGVLRSELNDALRRHLSKYLTNPDVRATPLLPLSVLGNVRNPGFFYAPADYLLRDLVMRAGGPAPDADVSKTEVRRAGKTIWNVKETRLAFAEGLSLDRLHLRAGDEVYVPPQRHRFQLTTILGLVSAAAAVSVALIQLQNH
jgi:protein involved in polysaccharide export with SLBB domain